MAHHLQENPDLCFVAADDSDQVVGFALGASTYEILADTGHLEWVAVAPSRRGEGIARRLLDTAVDAFRRVGRRQDVADASSDNAASRALFARAGWHEGISVTFFVRDLDEG